MWAGDVEKLDRIAGCGCCCNEHTHLWCDARYWGGCRSGYGPGESLEGEIASWRVLYPHLSTDEFYGERMREDAELRAELPWGAIRATHAGWYARHIAARDAARRT